MLTCQRASGALRNARSVGSYINSRSPYVAPVVAKRTLKSRASGDDKSWGEIASEAADVVKDVAKKVKDTAVSTIKAIIPSRQSATPTGRKQQQPSTIYQRDDDRPLPTQLPGGLFGGIVGGLLNSAVQGLAKEMEKTAQQTRSVAELAAERISSSREVKRRLGEVTVGLPMSQSVSSQSINGRVSKTVNLLLPVYNAAGVPVAQAQVAQTEGQYQQTTKIMVQMPHGDSIVLNDGNDSQGSSWSARDKVSQTGEIIDAEFKDIKEQ